MIFSSDIEIAVVYYRSGYAPYHYKTEDHWTARELLERSLAIKCPSIDYQLAGSKKLQEAFAIDSELQRFIPDASEREALTQHFAEFLSLEGPSAIDHIQKARKSPNDFVLKPQREGGGNNYFDEEIIQQFENFETDPEVQARIKSLTLMQRIKPPVSNSLLFKEGVLHKTKTVSELGVYGVFLSSPDENLINETAGYLLRTKSEGTNEGGVATGYSVLDTPYLV